MQPLRGHVMIAEATLDLLEAAELPLEALRVGGGDPLAPWQVDAVQPLFGHVMVLSEGPLAAVLEVLAEGGGAPVAPWQVDAVQPLFGHLVFSPWHVGAEHPDFGHTYVCPTAATDAAAALVFRLRERNWTPA